MDLLDGKAKTKRKKRQKRDKSKDSDKQDTKLHDNNTPQIPPTNGDDSHKAIQYLTTCAQQAEGHRAGYDAFMTAFCYSYDLIRYSRVKKACAFKDISFHSFDMKENFSNKIYLSGKDIPLQICKSEFAKTSKMHQNKFKVLKEQLESEAGK